MTSIQSEATNVIAVRDRAIQFFMQSEVLDLLAQGLAKKEIRICQIALTLASAVLPFLF